jgi:phage terminase large subunit
MGKAIKFKLASPKFKSIFTLKDSDGNRPDHQVYYSGRGTGKSVAIAQGVIFHSNKNKNMRSVVCRQFGSSIDESAQQELRAAAKMMGLEDHFIWTSRIITHKLTGSTITFMGLERNIGSIKGLSGVDLVWVEEAADISQESLDFLIPTIRKPGSVIMYSLNPRDKNDAVAKTFIFNKYPNSLVLRLQQSDNKFWTDKLQRDMDAMRAIDPDGAKVIWDGDFLGAGDKVFIKPVLIEQARNATPTKEPKLKIYAGLDVAGEGIDSTVLVRRQGNIILSKHKLAKGNVIENTDWVKNLYIEFPFDEIIIDATGSTGVADLIEQWGDESKQFETTKWNASRAARNKIKYTNARTESWGRMKEWLQNGGQLNNDSCWDEMSLIEFNWTTKEQVALVSKSTLKKSPDDSDALAMSLWFNDEVKVISAPTNYRTGAGFAG